MTGDTLTPSSAIEMPDSAPTAMESTTLAGASQSTSPSAAASVSTSASIARRLLRQSGLWLHSLALLIHEATIALLRALRAIFHFTIQFVGLYMLTVFIVVIGVCLVEIKQRHDLESTITATNPDMKQRVSNLIHYGASYDSLANIVADTTPNHQGTGQSHFDHDHMYISDTLSNMSCRTLLLISALLAGWSGSLVGTVYRKEAFEFRTSVIGLGASFVVWLGSHSSIQLVSLGAGLKNEPDAFDITLIAFLAGFAAQKVMQSLENLPIRGADPRLAAPAVAATPANNPTPQPAPSAAEANG